MVREVEARLAERFGLPVECVTTVSNATAGLTAALAAATRLRLRNVNDGPAYCLLPAWTFVASLHAVVGTGLEPYLLDVDEASRSEEHTSELQSLMRISYAVFCLKKKNINYNSILQTQ